MNVDAEVAAQFVYTLTVHRHCGPKVRVIVEILKPKNEDSAILDDEENVIEIIFPESHFQLLACSCHVKGLPTFLSNLFKSGLAISSLGSEHWIHQYCGRFDSEIYARNQDADYIFPPSYIEGKDLVLLHSTFYCMRHLLIVIHLT